MGYCMCCKENRDFEVNKIKINYIGEQSYIF